jgi:8-oxo-dGTP diphosphatase
MGERSAIRVVSAEIQRDGRYLITQRSARAVLPLLWEFPGGRVRDGETDAEALARCVRERVGVTVEVHHQLLEVNHGYDHYGVALGVYRCTLEPGAEPWPENVAALAWVAADEFGDYPFPGADQKTVEMLLRDH